MVNVLTAENVTKFAQEAMSLTPLSCEWSGTCEAELNSWGALREHTQLHLRHLKEETDGSYRCRLPRCSCFYHATMHDLKKHVESGHLTRLPIPCPAAGCPMSFVHHALFPHFSQVHGDLISTPAAHKAGKLKDMRTPRHPPRSQFWEVPSKLPAGPTPLHTIMTLPMARSRRKGVPSQAPTASQARRKWNKMRGEGYIGEDDDEESAPFDTLHLLDTKALPDFAKSIIVRRKPPEPVPQLSRPPRVAIPPIPEKAPPVSSGFGAFQEKYRELEKAGLIDGTGEWPDDDNNGSPLPTQPSTQPSA